MKSNFSKKFASNSEYESRDSTCNIFIWLRLGHFLKHRQKHVNVRLWITTKLSVKHFIINAINPIPHVIYELEISLLFNIHLNILLVKLLYPMPSLDYVYNLFFDLLMLNKID